LHSDTSDIPAQEEGDCAQAPQDASSNNADKLLIGFTTSTPQIDLGCLEVFAESANIAKTCVSTAPDGALFCLVRTGRRPKYLFSGTLECGKSGSNFLVCNARSYLRYLTKIRATFTATAPRAITAPDVRKFRDLVAKKSGVVQANRHLELLGGKNHWSS
jgi:hypothetical protein